MYSYCTIFSAVAPKLCDTLSIIRYQVGELNNTDKASRELYYHCIQDVIHQAILLFPIYVQHTSQYLTSLECMQKCVWFEGHFLENKQLGQELHEVT